MDPAWLTALTALAVAVFGVLGWAARYGWRVLRRTMHFLDDWGGEEAHDGLGPRPASWPGSRASRTSSPSSTRNCTRTAAGRCGTWWADRGGRHRDQG